jgi:hypothetical protein
LTAHEDEVEAHPFLSAFLGIDLFEFPALTLAITFGYHKDHRPDPKQLLFILTEPTRFQRKLLRLLGLSVKDYRG